jgi:hypothetical protein
MIKEELIFGQSIPKTSEMNRADLSPRDKFNLILKKQ